jgi:hypothetical protein
MKILQISNFGIKKNLEWFYNSDYKLYYGLVRLGHAVYQFSNRDIAKQVSIFKSRFGAAAKVNKKLLKICDNLRPDMILIGHAEMISNETLQQIKLKYGTKIVLFNVDALWVEHIREHLLHRSKVADAMFLTTAGESLEQFRKNCPKVSFIPNPVDPAIDKYKLYENETHNYDIFFAGAGEFRINTINFLKEQLPEAKFNVPGQLGKPLKYGQSYWDELTQCRIGLNLPQFAEEKYNPPLYSSDRLAQYMGNGLATFIYKVQGYQDYFEDGKEAFFYDSNKHLAELLKELVPNKELLKEVAQKGREKYHMWYNSEIISQYIVDVTFDKKYKFDYNWPT